MGSQRVGHDYVTDTHTTSSLACSMDLRGSRGVTGLRLVLVSLACLSTWLPLGGAACPECGSRVISLRNLFCLESVGSGFHLAGSFLALPSLTV